MLKLGSILAATTLLLSCGGVPQGRDESLVEKVCDHAMAVARKEQVGDFTREKCLVEVRKRADKLRGGFHGWAHCLLGMSSIEEAKLLCRERDYLQPM